MNRNDPSPPAAFPHRRILHPTASRVSRRLDRRHLLGGVLASAAGLWLAGCNRSTPCAARDAGMGRNPHGTTPPRQLPPTPTSGEPHAPPPMGAVVETPGGCIATEDNIEGPFFLPGAPERAALADANTPGFALSIRGRVLTTDCRPVRNAVIAFWQADHQGVYDRTGYHFRGRLRCDQAGNYALNSIVPGRYLNGSRYRPAHIHAKILVDGLRPLTTQLYFPGDPYNEGDPFIRSSLIVRTTPVYDRVVVAQFDFVLPPA